MFRSLDHPQGATLFLAKVTSKTFIKFLYINRVLWQHDNVLNKYNLYYRHAATTPC